jgi:hypothetical protein
MHMRTRPTSIAGTYLKQHDASNWKCRLLVVKPTAWPAAQAMKRNVAFNGGAAAAKVQPQQGDARIVMMQNAGVRVLSFYLPGWFATHRHGVACSTWLEHSHLLKTCACRKARHHQHAAALLGGFPAI